MRRNAASGATSLHRRSGRRSASCSSPTRSWRFRRGRRAAPIWCDIVAQEVREKERIVLESDQVVALSPWAARSPFELWILPRGHRSSFQSAIGQELGAIGDALRTILRKVDVALEKPAFNLFLHTMPLRTPENDFYHWHLDVKPVLTQQAGFEWASGCYINPTPPEEAASFLRQTEVFP